MQRLSDLASGYEDLGPMVECVVWHDGERWQAALDTADLHPEGSSEVRASTGNSTRCGDGLMGVKGRALQWVCDFTPMTGFHHARLWAFCLPAGPPV